MEPIELPIPAADKLAKAERAPRAATSYPPLEHVTSPTVTTEAAAYYLNRKPQTLRAHACKDTGIVRPLRINGRLAYPVAELRRVLGVA
ncbi:hypothetical protein [Variovorax sp. dw_954]|uniref:hypothetical protein n=1 Tax=Variovorax sp. dw_954 TaxID=2720078 RepID=UPI002115D982|nr:hypothetical protein [Variovorax sp. dw_954]